MKTDTYMTVHSAFPQCIRVCINTRTKKDKPGHRVIVSGECRQAKKVSAFPVSLDLAILHRSYTPLIRETTYSVTNIAAAIFWLWQNLSLALFVRMKANVLKCCLFWVFTHHLLSRLLILTEHSLTLG